MAFDWVAYLELARELARRADDASLRSAISRAYYSALGKARERLEREEIVLPYDASIHAQTWQEFLDSPDDFRYYIGLDGRWLRTNRNAADYESEIAGLPIRARQAIKKADSILASLNRLA